MKKKHILIIQQSLQGGGAEKVLIDIIKNFNYDIYDITLLLLDTNGVYNNQIPSKVNVKYLLTSNEQFILGYLQKLKLWILVDIFYKLRLKRVLGGQYFDTIVSFMEGISCRCHSFVMKRAKKNVTWVHIDLVLNNWCLCSFKSFKEQSQIYSMMDTIVAVSEGVKDSFMKLFPGTSPRVVYNLIDKPQIFDKATAFTVGKQSFTVCNVGRLAKQKRQDRIVEVASLCKFEGLDIHFNILGQGPLKDSLQEQIDNYGVQDYVSLLGFQANPYPHIASSDVFLLSSDSEGYPLVVCESICLGKPIISTDVTGPHELLCDGTGILCSKQPRDLFDAIKRIYLDAELRKKYAKRSLKKSAIFDIERQMKEIYSII